jgi:hypothetical protein
MIIIIWARPQLSYTEYLYGDDISKKVSDIDSVNKVGRKVMRGRGSDRFLRRRGGRFGSRRGGRGRGFGRIPFRDGQDRGDAGASTRYDHSKNFRRGFSRKPGTRY